MSSNARAPKVTKCAAASGGGASSGNGRARKSRLPRGALRTGSPLPPVNSDGIPRAIYNEEDTQRGGWNETSAYGVEPRIFVENPRNQDTTLVRCKGFDRVMQLATLTTSISSFGLEIKSAFIRPKGEPLTVEDMFYVSTHDGEQLSSSEHDALIKHMSNALGLHTEHELGSKMGAHYPEGAVAGTSGYDAPPPEGSYTNGYNGHHQVTTSHAQGFSRPVKNYHDPDYDPENDHRHNFHTEAEMRELEQQQQQQQQQNVSRGWDEDAYGHNDQHRAQPSFFDKQEYASPTYDTPAYETPAYETSPASHTHEEQYGYQQGPDPSAFDYKSSPQPYKQPSVAEGSIPVDAAAVLSAQLRVAAAEMAAAAAEFVQLERERASATDPDAIAALQQPRLDAQLTLEQTMSAMQGMLAERDQLRGVTLGGQPVQTHTIPEYTGTDTSTWPEYQPPPPLEFPSYEPPKYEPYQAAAYEPVTMPKFEPKQPEPQPEPEMEEEPYPEPPPPLDTPIPEPDTPMGSGREVILQGFNWESCNSSKSWYSVLTDEVHMIREAGFTAVWMPPPTKSVSDQGYLPSDLYNLNSFYGTHDELLRCIWAMQDNGICPVADIVINHRCAEAQDEQGRWNIYTGRMAWDQRAITTDNPEFGGQGNHGTGEDYGPAPNIDHTQDWVRRDLKEWLHWMKHEIGFGGWRFDFVKGYGGQFTGEYVADTQPFVAVGEHWVSCNYSGCNLEYNQDSHRQSTYDWCKATNLTTAGFDFTTKGILQEAVRNSEYWRMRDSQGHPSGFCGMLPTHAVTFLENHDTGSTLQHWPFPTNGLGQGYAYILTHPGTPTVFYDHWKDGALRDHINQLIDIRKRVGIMCNAAVKIERAEDGLYAAHIGSPRHHVHEGTCEEVDMSLPSICMKMGHGDWSPNRDRIGGARWKCVCSGDGWAVWEDERHCD